MECDPRDCAGCQSSCGSCPSHSGPLLLTREELEVLLRFAQLPFLPVGRRAGEETPVFLEESGASPLSPALEGLRLKGLVQVDEDLPLTGFDYAPFRDFPHQGSAALTQSGQNALELYEIQGAED